MTTAVEKQLDPLMTDAPISPDDHSSDDSSTSSDRGAPALVDVEVTAQEEADLSDSLAELSRLAVGRGQQGLEDMLRHVATYAVQAIPGADGAGLTLHENERRDTIVVSTPFVREVDNVQYGIGEGPCITAAAEGRTVRSGNLGGDSMWPRFGPRVGRLGVHSALSLPLISDGAILGAMNVYAHARDAFSDRAAEIGEAYSVPAAISVLNAQALHAAQRLAQQLQDALTSRAVIDRGVGIIISRVGCTSEEAFDRLRAISQNEHVKLVVVAERLVQEAAARARARHTDR